MESIHSMETNFWFYKANGSLLKSKIELKLFKPMLSNDTILKEYPFKSYRETVFNYGTYINKCM